MTTIIHECLEWNVNYDTDTDNYKEYMELSEILNNLMILRMKFEKQDERRRMEDVINELQELMKKKYDRFVVKGGINDE